MTPKQIALYAGAIAVLVGGLLWRGVPASTLLFGWLLLAVPILLVVIDRVRDNVHDADRGATIDRKDSRLR